MYFLFQDQRTNERSPKLGQTFDEKFPSVEIRHLKYAHMTRNSGKDMHDGSLPGYKLLPCWNRDQNINWDKFSQGYSLLFTFNKNEVKTKGYLEPD